MMLHRKLKRGELKLLRNVIIRNKDATLLAIELNIFRNDMFA